MCILFSEPGENLNEQRNTDQLQNKEKPLEVVMGDLENQTGNSTTDMDHCRIVICVVIGSGAGTAIVLIFILVIYLYNKSKQRRHLDVEEGGDEREPLLPTMHQAGGENRRLRGQELPRNFELPGVNKQLLDIQDEIKNLLENQKDHLAKRLQDIETKREKNKEELQSVEKTLNETTTFDEKELVLKQKEELLQSQWKLDEEKKNYDRQLLFIEKVLEPIEIQMTRITKRNGDV
ncbi:hypothetical protein AMECASPLE_030213 [Ameca splendens]|uniref:Uncharacterized protein n=1 Tax=Ameca splendens TaxID=208324 RepID=A0ABV0XJ58_9TELE